jgi:uncharacterized protein YycO
MRKPFLPLSLILSLVLFFGIGACLAIQSVVKENFIKRKVDKGSITKELMEGDIIFQSTMSRQCEAVKIATKSNYSHVGILFKRAGEWMVYEAVQPVKFTKLSEWITHGKNNHFVVKRLENRDSFITDSIAKVMKQEGVKYLNKDYDIYFGWSDESMYCSELVWKIYKDAVGVEVGKLQKLKDFDLSEGIVKNIVEERYGKNTPWEETVVSPAAIFASSNLETIVNK